MRPRDRRLPARKLWIAFAVAMSGTIVVDDGARRALVERGRSLLPAGIVDVRGDFEADDAVEIADAGGRVFAKGLVRLSAVELKAAAGRRTGDLPEGTPHEASTPTTWWPCREPPDVGRARRRRRGARRGRSGRSWPRCTTIRGLIDTEDALERAGFTEVDVGFSSDNGFDQVEVTVRPPSVEGDADAPGRAGGPRSCGRTSPCASTSSGSSCSAPLRRAATPPTPTARWPRSSAPGRPDLDEKELGDDVVRAGLGVAIVLVVGGLLFTGRHRAGHHLRRAGQPPPGVGHAPALAAGAQALTPAEPVTVAVVLATRNVTSSAGLTSGSGAGSAAAAARPPVRRPAR